MNIRPATSADIPAILALERTAPSAGHWSAEQYQSALLSETPRRISFVIEGCEGLRGFLVGREVEKEWELENIVVSDSARRHGLGEALLAELLRRLQQNGAKSVHLEVRESNVAARALYEKCNFLQTGRRRRYYENPPEDAILYCLELG